MWRRFGGSTYATLTLAVFTVQAAALVLLTWVFVFDRIGISPEGFVMREALAAAVAITALAVMVLTAYTLVYQAISSTRQQLENREADIWRQRWVRVLFQDERPPAGRLSAPAVEALVNVREKLTGTDAERVDALLSDKGITEDLLGIASSPRRYGLARRLDALDLLARAGAPRGFDALVALTNDPEPAVRMMAVRALARAAASLRQPEARTGASFVLVDVFQHAEVPAGAIEEALLVLGPAAPDVLALMLKVPDQPELVAAALDAASRLHCAELLGDVAAMLDAPDKNVRCAAWRAVDGIGVLPKGGVRRLHAALTDADPQIRGQACRAARLLESGDALKRLGQLLADPSWWVRRGAAKSMVRLGADGIAALHDAGRAHPDRFARHIALDVLVDSHALMPTLALDMRAAS